MIRMRGRLVVLQVLVVSLLALLAVRLWQVQVVRGDEFVVAATETRTRDVVVPAVRGQILDAAGRPLVRNRTRLVVSVDRTSLNRMEGNGRGVLQRLATVLDRRPADLRERIRACGPGVTRPCWPGSPYQPIPIDDDVTTRRPCRSWSGRRSFPGSPPRCRRCGSIRAAARARRRSVTCSRSPRRSWSKRDGLKAVFSGVDLVGRDGLESVYDERAARQARACGGCRWTGWAR